MGQPVKVAVRLPAALFTAAERERKAKGQTRSEFFREALDAALQRRGPRAAAARYVRAYRRMPEAEPEVSGIHSVSGAILAEEPWD